MSCSGGSALPSVSMALKRNEQLHKTNNVSECVYLKSRSNLDEAEALVDERRQVLALAGMTP
jgi:hypothetical protein